jgi:hypothetical protein
VPAGSVIANDTFEPAQGRVRRQHQVGKIEHVSALVLVVRAGQQVVGHVVAREQQHVRAGSERALQRRLELRASPPGSAAGVSSFANPKTGFSAASYTLISVSVECPCPSVVIVICPASKVPGRSAGESSVLDSVELIGRERRRQSGDAHVQFLAAPESVPLHVTRRRRHGARVLDRGLDARDRGRRRHRVEAEDRDLVSGGPARGERQLVPIDAGGERAGADAIVVGRERRHVARRRARSRRDARDRVTRLHAGDDGRARFAVVGFELHDHGGVLARSDENDDAVIRAIAERIRMGTCKSGALWKQDDSHYRDTAGLHRHGP